MIELDQTFDLFFPVNEIVWKVKRLVAKSISDLSGINMSIQSNYILMNKETNRVYHNNEIIMNTDIRNGTELLFFSAKVNN